MCSAEDKSMQGRCDDGANGTGLCKSSDQVDANAFAECKDMSSPCPIDFSDVKGDLVLTSLITSVADEQRHYFHKCDISDREWYTTVKSLNLSALVMHDCLTRDQIVRLQTQRIRFVSISGPVNISLGDFRYPLYYGLLTGQPVFGNGESVRLDVKWQPPVKNVFITDLFDVWFAGNPFDIVYGNRYRIYMGKETLPWGEWMFDKAKTCGYTDEQVHNHPSNVTDTMYNTGIIGGPVESVSLLLRLMSIKVLTLSNKMANCDMPFLNYILKDVFGDSSVFTGHPLHSRFASYERNVGAYIYHK